MASQVLKSFLTAGAQNMGLSLSWLIRNRGPAVQKLNHTCTKEVYLDSQRSSYKRVSAEKTVEAATALNDNLPPSTECSQKYTNAFGKKMQSHINEIGTTTQ